jgi:Response regulator containing a CheY-like receiver domain and an HTH DNA-binding domain
MERLRIVMADDQTLFIESLKSVIETRSDDIEVVGVAQDGKRAVELVSRLKPDIALLDVRMPVMDGVEATSIIRDRNPETQVVILTTYDDEVYVHDALSKGAVGYLLKETQPSNLIMCLRAVKEGSVMISPAIAKKLVRQLDLRPRDAGEGAAPWLDALSKREKEVLLLLAQGLSNQGISERLCIEEQTVRNHVSMIYSKIGVHDRIELMLLVNRPSS